MNKIICKNVPDGLLKKEAAKNHFQQFGSVKRIVVKPPSRVITVEYNGLDAIERVIKYGSIFDNKSFSILKESADTSLERPKVVLSKKGIPTKNTNIDLPEDVMAELEAMRGGPFRDKSYPRQVLNIDTPKKILKRRGPSEKDIAITKKTKPLAFTSDNAYQDLLDILDQRALTIDDKYKVLDARDKILRMIQKKNGTNNGSTRGTCPDMCPEKERLLRVIQHQVSYFEHNSSKEMDPSLAVKQYSRSSADQESPLPHELRPVAVLQITMSYLINNVMPLGETSNVNIGDWYHFLWDRTRSIRKDITQQELCCRNTVELLEQCARFHIHCSARLVAEDPSVFDQKINTENLTKCLQTLKYMYHDLRLKGEICPNEAEFRAYIILLNLNDGNFMWEVQRLPIEIQGSPQMKIAIQIHTVLNEHNFVKFFKLVRNSSYLNACILMRYFMQIRIRAIDVILRCYTPRITKVVYPLDTLTLNLGFEGVQQTIEFVQLCGLNINDSRSSVILDRTCFTAPDLTYTAIDRSMNLVESKRAELSLGQIVCGGTVPICNPHVPHNSFDDEGYLEKPFNAEDFCEPLTEGDDIIAEEPSETVLEPPTESLNNQEIQELSSQDENEYSNLPAIEEVPPPVDEFDAPNVTEASAHNDEIIDEKPNKVVNNFSTTSLFGNTNNSETSIFGNKMNIFGGLSRIWNETNSTNQNNKWPTATAKNQFNQTFPSSYYHPVSIPECAFDKEFPQEIFTKKCYVPKQNVVSNLQSLPFADQVCALQRALENDEQKKELETKNPKKVIDHDDKEISEPKKHSPAHLEEIRSTVEFLLAEMVDKIVSDHTQNKIQKLKTRILKRKIMRVLNKWRDFVIHKKRARDMKQWTSGCIHPGKLVERSEQFEFILKSSNVLMKGLDKDHKIEDMVKLSEKKVDFSKLAEYLAKQYKNFTLNNGILPKQKLYWKCVISTPDDHECFDSSQIINEKLQTYFGLSDDGKPLLKQEFVDRTPIRFCIEKNVGCSKKLNDADGLIFIAKNLNDLLYKRILEKFNTTGVFYKVPIVLILQDRPEHLSNIKSLLRNNIISSYSLLVDSRPSRLIPLVEKGLQFLTSNVNPPPPIEVNYLEAVLFRDLLGSQVWKNASCYGVKNYAYGKCLKNPNTVIRVYNQSLKEAKSLLLDEACFEYARFPLDFRQFEEHPDCSPMDYRHLPEIGGDLKYREYISHIFDVLMPLKTMPRWPPKNEVELITFIWDFAINNFEDRAEVVYHKLLTHINAVMDDTIEDIMWTDLMDILMLEKHKCYQRYLRENPIPDSWQYNEQILIVYHNEYFPAFLKSDWFYLNNPIIQETISYDEEMLAEKGIDQPSSKEIEETILRVRGLLTRESPAVKYNMDKFNAQMNDLSESMRLTKKLSRRFVDQAD